MVHYKDPLAPKKNLYDFMSYAYFSPPAEEKMTENIGLHHIAKSTC